MVENLQDSFICRPLTSSNLYVQRECIQKSLGEREREEGKVRIEMDGRGGCCISRYSGGGGGGGMSYGMSKVEKIMLKFRPIAPKPMAAGSGSSCSTIDNSDGCGGARRRKRKYVRVNGNKNKKETNTVSKKKKASTSSSSVSGGRDAVVTQSLMSDRKEISPATPCKTPDLLSFVPRNKPALVSCDGDVRGAVGHVVSVADHAVVSGAPSPPPPPPPPPQRSQVVSFVTVECVTETWLNSDGVGFTDEAGMMSMERDACPSFITNSLDTVVWTNKAYRDMTAGGGSEKTAVAIVKKYNRVTMPVSLPAFTCKVKVTWGTERTSSSTLTAPCDVWRLQSGGYAWRLDVKAALSLGRFC